MSRAWRSVSTVGLAYFVFLCVMGPSRVVAEGPLDDAQAAILSMDCNFEWMVRYREQAGVRSRKREAADGPLNIGGSGYSLEQ